MCSPSFGELHTLGRRVYKHDGRTDGRTDGIMAEVENTCRGERRMSAEGGRPAGHSSPQTPTPTRKNKRKMSEPRKRTDVSAKRISLEDGSEDLFDDSDDDSDADSTLAVRKLDLGNTPEPSSGSEQRNNSAGSGYSPAPILIPTVPSQLLGGAAVGSGAGGALGAILQTPVIATKVGCVPPYAFLPAFRPALFPPPGQTVAPPGFVLAQDVTSRSAMSSSPSDHKAMAVGEVMDNNHNCVQQQQQHGAADGKQQQQQQHSQNNHRQQPSPSGSQYSAPSPSPSVSSAGLDSQSGSRTSGRKQRKNYKNMTRERRVEANARERTRVHTISAAFESLRRAVPSYSYHQRLSKLAILRIACSYILALSRLADMDYSEDQDGLSFSECVDLCTQTIQSEGRAKRRH